MSKSKAVPDSTELLYRLSRLAGEAEWTTEELQEALCEGGVDPDQLVQQVRTRVRALLKESPDPAPQAEDDASRAPQPLLGMLRDYTQRTPKAIAQAMDAPVPFLALVSKYPKAVPNSWRRELATRAEQALGAPQPLVMESLAQSFQYPIAASRDAPYPIQTLTYEDLLDRSGMSQEAKDFWRTLAKEAL